MDITHLAKILFCATALFIPTVSSALSYAVPTVSVQNVATAIRMTGATLAVSVAVKQLLKGVDFVMDPENNQARSKEKVDYCSHGGTPCVNTPEEAVKYAMQSDFAVHWKYPFKGCKLDPKQGNGTINCTFEKDGDIRTVAFFSFNTIVKSASYEEIAEQIIANAKNGDKEAIAYLQSVVNQNKLKPSVPANPPKDETKPDVKPKPANPPKLLNPPKKKEDKNETDNAPTKAECNTAIKILEQYERLSSKSGSRLSPKRIQELNAKRDLRTITIYDLPASLRSKFPARFLGMTLSEIRAVCSKAR
ncbi:Uncharacterised protein [Moraxella lacunata]|uniref:Uncharacterized protein n=1 Tax=Moraxella lacunata TaxID=477 RepID=A0A378TTM8_MORLA|nr:hypothetical protein [Moraxella lacunata]STZ63981.1 Uncharacterised protein [Moraxella lacunata]